MIEKIIGKEELISKRISEMKNCEVHQRTKDSVDNEGEKLSDQKGQASLFIYGEAEIQSKSHTDEYKEYYDVIPYEALDK